MPALPARSRMLTGIFFFQAEDGIRDLIVTGVQTCALPISTLKDPSGNVLSGRTATWVSSAPAVAMVSGGGLVTGVGAGSATLTATSEGQSGSRSEERRGGEECRSRWSPYH